jgi:hypothetical protein
MIRLQDLLLEAGELAPYPFTYNQWGTQFTTTRGTTYEVGCGVDGDGEMEISFGVIDDHGYRNTEITTGENDQYRIMSTIIAIVQRAVADRKPKKIYFGAYPTRIAMYMRYLTPLLRSYEIETKREDLVVMRRKGLLKRIAQYDWTGIKDKP